MFYFIDTVGIGRSEVFSGHPVVWSIVHGCLKISSCCEILDKSEYKCLDSKQWQPKPEEKGMHSTCLMDQSGSLRVV